MKNLTNIEQRVLSCILMNDVVTRTQLENLTGYNDRINRKTIENLRKKGNHIAHIQGKGYKIAYTDKEKSILFNSYAARIKSEIETLIALSDEVQVTEMVYDFINRTNYTG